MNILVDELPTAIEIDDDVFDIDTDFRSCLRTILAYEDPLITDNERRLVLLVNLYGNSIPDDLDKAVKAGLKFLDGGNEPEEGDSIVGPRVYSFSKDSNFIYAAFKQTHNIDLNTASLHWWKFLALFMDLGPDTTFCNLIQLRRKLKTGKASKEERALARDMSDIIDLPEPDTRTAEERRKEDEFLRLIRGS